MGETRMGEGSKRVDDQIATVRSGRDFRVHLKCYRRFKQWRMKRKINDFYYSKLVDFEFSLVLKAMVLLAIRCLSLCTLYWSTKDGVNQLGQMHVSFHSPNI